MAASRAPLSKVAATMILAIGGILLSGCATSPPPACESNFDTQGGFVTGKRFTTFSVVPNISDAAAFDSLYKVLVSDGYYIETADQKAGVISAFQNVNFSDKKAPLNALVESQANGAKISLIFVAPGGVFTPEGGARDEFCRIIARVHN